MNQVYCTQIIITTNYLAATAWLLLCCCTAISHRRLVFLFSPVHHFHEELYQLLLVFQEKLVIF